MVGKIDIRSITLDELVGTVNLYPWYGVSRVELCRRMLGMGNSLSQEQLAAAALFVPNRGLFAEMMRHAGKSAYTDKNVKSLLASYMEPAPAEPSQPQHQVRAVSGDYFSQAQYDQVQEGSDKLFPRMALRVRQEGRDISDESTDIADRFATETLARIFVEQGRPDQARRIYSRLILDFPEKSAYFASLIDNLD